MLIVYAAAVATTPMAMILILAVMMLLIRFLAKVFQLYSYQPSIQSVIHRGIVYTIKVLVIQSK